MQLLHTTAFSPAFSGNLCNGSGFSSQALNECIHIAFQKCSVREEYTTLVNSDSPAEHAFIQAYMKLHCVLIEEKICFLSPFYMEDLCLINSCNACKFSEASGLDICNITSLLKY